MLAAGVVRSLRARGDEVVVLQRSPAELGDEVHEVLGDVRDIAVARTAVAGCDAVVHAAAKVDVIGQWHDFESINFGGTQAVMSAATDAGVESFVYVSTPSVAHAGRSIVGEGATPADVDGARGHYARSKAMAEQHALASGDLAVVAIRPHLVWGPGDTQLVGRMVERAKAGRLATIGTGAALIDSTVVDNAVAALVAGLDRAAEPEVRGRPFVVSNGEPRPVGELIRAIVEAHGVEMPQRRVPKPVAMGAGKAIGWLWERADRAEPPLTDFLVEQLTTAHWFDLRETRSALGWEPQVSIDEGLRRLAAAAAAGS